MLMLLAFISRLWGMYIVQFSVPLSLVDMTEVAAGLRIDNSLVVARTSLYELGKVGDYEAPPLKCLLSCFPQLSRAMLPRTRIDLVRWYEEQERECSTPHA